MSPAERSDDNPATPRKSWRMDPRIAALAFAETLVWAGTFYIFPALIAHWDGDLGWSKTVIAGAFTAALFTSAASAPFVGRIIDAGHGARVLTGGALGCGVLIGLVSLVDQVWQFYALWIALGACMACCLYEPCFAFLTRTRGEKARSAITQITLIAGLAGTVSFPVANLLAELHGWRAATAGFSAIILLLALPLFRYGTKRREEDDDPTQAAARSGATQAGFSRVRGRPTFWLLAVAFAMIALTHGIIINHLLPMLEERGIPLAMAVLAASMIGPMQVAGRIAMLVLEKHVSMSVICAISYVFMVAAIVSLMGAGAIPLLLIVFVLFQGSGYGVTSITRPVVTADLLGREGFGGISGALALPFMAATALSPTIAAAMWEVGGYDTVRMTVLALVLFGAACFTLAVVSARQASR
jgi:MFS family permease